MTAMKHLITLAIIASAVVVVRPASAADNAGPDIEALHSRFVNPPPGSGTKPLWVLSGGKMTKERIRQRLLIMRDKEGYGGLSPEPLVSKGGSPTDPAFLSDEYVEMYGYILDTAKELGMTVVFYDDSDFPSGKAGGQMAKKYPEYLLKYLARGVTTVAGPAAAVVRVPQGSIMSVVAKDLKTGERRVVTAEAHRSADGDSVQWQAPAGRWEVQAFVCATAPRKFLVDFLEPEAVKKFLELTYEPFYKKFPEHFGTTIQMTFYDDLSIYQAPDNLIWTPAFNEKFQKRFGRSPEALYPALWEDIGPETGSARVSLYGMRNELFAAGYPRTVQEWCAQRGMVCSGHPANDYRPDPFNGPGDAILFYKYQGAPLVDYIQYLGNGVDGFKIAGSAAYNFDRDTVACEIYGNLQKRLPKDSTMLDLFYRGGMQVYTRGINFLIPNYISGDSGGFSWRNPTLGPGLPEFNRWAARCETLLRAGRHVADIAVLYPIDDLEANHSVGNQPEKHGKNSPPGAEYYDISRLLTGEVKRDFTFLHPETLNERCSVDGAELVLNNPNRWERYRVVILPACRTIRADNLIKVRDFLRQGGRVIATTCLPERASESGRDAEVQAMAKEMFGPGGKGIFVPAPDETTLRKALDGLAITWDVRLDNVTDIPRTEALGPGYNTPGGAYGNGNREFAYIHRSVPGAEAYFFANSSEFAVQADVTLRGKMTLELWDPHTGTSQELDGTPAQENGEAVTRFKLKLPVTRSVFVIGRNTK